MLKNKIISACFASVSAISAGASVFFFVKKENTGLLDEQTEQVLDSVNPVQEETISSGYDPNKEPQNINMDIE